MAKTVYLVRHGQTQGDVSGIRRYKGSIDVPLSGEGEEQIKRTSMLIKGRSMTPGSMTPLKAVYTSNLMRALRSAEIIAADNGLKPIVVPELRERNFGLWEGMSFDEIKQRYPSEFSQWAKDPLRHSPIAGESTLEVKERVMKAFGEILRNHDEGAISIVGHGGVNRVILSWLLKIPIENLFSIEQDYACLNIIEFWDEYPVVKLINGGVYG